MIRFGLKEKDIALINAIFAQYPNIEEVVLYGSRAKGNYKTGSDIDMTIVENDLTMTDFLKISNDIDDILLPYKIDLSQKRKISNPELIEHINRVGQLFYLKNSHTMQTYTTLSEAITDLKAKGYTEDFNLKENQIQCSNGTYKIFADDFHVDSFFRFEDNTDPDDQSILYALSSKKYKIKGLLVNAYGIYSDNIADEIMNKLKLHV